MLSTALKPLKEDIFNILTGEDAKEAFKKALLATFPTDSQNCETSQFIAESFGNIAASYLGALASPLAEAIDKYVKEIGITLTPQGLTAPNGPVSGSTGPTSFKIS